MQPGLEKRISYLAQSAEVLRDAANEETGGLQNMKFQKHDGGATLTGNRSGLIELARHILQVASGEWQHTDIDEATFASRSDGTLTIALDQNL